MHQVNNAAGFIYENMPLGKGRSLTEQEAWDVAFFMNAHERPQDPPLHRIRRGNAQEIPRQSGLALRDDGQRTLAGQRAFPTWCSNALKQLTRSPGPGFLRQQQLCAQTAPRAW